MRKTTYDENGDFNTEKDYVGGFIYQKNGSQPKELELYNTAEGRVRNNSGTYEYEYDLKDHLGNVRVTFTETDATTPKEKTDYYPFGLQFNKTGDENKFTYNDKERDTETEINGYDGLDYFGARYYDPVIGRWLAVDPLAGKYPSFSPYNYTLNNPIVNVDPNGKETWGFEFANLVGVGTGGTVSGGFVWDDKGNVGIFAKVGIGGVIGATVGGSVGFQNTSARTIFDLSDVGFSFGLNASLIVSAGNEFNAGTGQSYFGNTESTGLGSVGASAYGLIEWTEVLTSPGVAKLKNHYQNGGSFKYENGNIVLVDKNGKIISEMKFEDLLDVDTSGAPLIDMLKNHLNSSNEASPMIDRFMNPDHTGQWQNAYDVENGEVK